MKNSVGKNLHVFFVASPIIQIVTALAIKHLGLKEEDILCVVVRESDTSLIQSKKIRYKTTSFDRVLNRFFQVSYSDLILRKKIEASCDNFYVYCTWFDNTIESLLESSKCMGHYYMEEGQLAYYSNDEFDVDAEISRKERQRRKSAGSNDYHFRSDALGYFGLNKDSFPNIPQNRKVILSNFTELLKQYRPKLLGIQNVAIFPAPHRIKIESVEKLVDVYLESIGNEGVIKLHPGFVAYPDLTASIKNIILHRGFLENCMCGSDVILELEMLYESKNFFGARSSLSTYAELFGSEYNILSLPGYNQPIN